MVFQMGRISIHWSILELRIEEAIWLLSGLTRKQGRLLTAKENLEPRLKLLKKRAKEKLTSDQSKVVDDLIEDIKIAGKQRKYQAAIGESASSSMICCARIAA